MSGTSVRLGRLLDKQSRRSFMVAFDRTLSLGAEPFAEDSAATITTIASHGADAILLSPGLIKQHAHLLAYRGAPAIVARIDFPFIDPVDGRHADEFRLIASVEEVASLGADAVVMFHILDHGGKGSGAANVAAIGKVAQAARQSGIPLIVEAVPWGPATADIRDPQVVAAAARIAAELGADAIKTEYVGSTEGMRSVIDSCPVPVFVLGGPTVDVPALLAATKDALAAGAAGVIYGRNVWQRENCAEVSAALTEVVHGSVATAGPGQLEHREKVYR